jgi:hypothetical protein
MKHLRWAAIAWLSMASLPLCAEQLPSVPIKWELEAGAARADLVINETGGAVTVYRICQINGPNVRINTVDGGRPTELSKGVCMDVVSASSIWVTRSSPTSSEAADGSLALLYAGMIGQGR